MRKANALIPAKLPAMLIGLVVLQTACTPVPDVMVKHNLMPYERIDSTPKRQATGISSAAYLPEWANVPTLSPGDKLRIEVVDAEMFDGLYEVGLDGMLRMPFIDALQATNRHPAQLEQQLRAALIHAQYLKAHHAQVSLRVHEWSAAEVHVSGAVFNPGPASINQQTAEQRQLKSELHSGDFPAERTLSAALRSAGGIRPDADLSRVELQRQGQRLLVDMTRLLDGHAVADPALMTGDRVIVPSSGQFDERLVKPTDVTLPGIRVFLSNLTVPSSNNASSAIGKHATSVPYGSRLLTAAVSSNCVGGTYSTNSSRYVVMVGTDPLTNQQATIERPVEQLLEAPNDRVLNPYLMPNDQVACYDSGVSNLRDIARTIAELLLPLSLL